MKADYGLDNRGWQYEMPPVGDDGEVAEAEAVAVGVVVMVAVVVDRMHVA